MESIFHCQQLFMISEVSKTGWRLISLQLEPRETHPAMFAALLLIALSFKIGKMTFER